MTDAPSRSTLHAPRSASPRDDASVEGGAWSEGGVSLVVQTSFLGDVVLTTPLIAELARRGPVDVVVRPDAAAILAHNPDVRRLIVYDKRGAHSGATGVWRMAGRLRQLAAIRDRKSTRLNSSHPSSSYAVFCLHNTSTPLSC